MFFQLQFDYNGSFRIVAPDGTKGEWARYECLAGHNSLMMVYKGMNK